MKGLNRLNIAASLSVWTLLLSFVVLCRSASAQTISSVAFTPASVAGGASSTGKVTLTKKAGGNGLSLSLSSSSGSATVPANLSVPAGSSSATFSVATSAVSSLQTAKITVSGAGTKTGTLTITAAVLSSVSLSPATVNGGQSSTGTVTLNGSAGPNGATVTLKSSLSAVGVSPSVAIPSGQSSATFSVSTSGVVATTPATITAKLGTVSKTAKLTLSPAKIQSISLSPQSVTGGSTGTGTVTLAGKATGTGAKVLLTSSNPSAATVPGNVVVPAGSNQATFSFSSSQVLANASATISGTYGGGTASQLLTVNVASVQSLTLDSPSVPGGSSVTGTVTLSGLAGTGGVAVSLLSSNSSVTTPGTVTVQAGESSATFSLTTVAVASDTPAAINAAAGGATQTALLTVSAPQLQTVSVMPVSLPGGNSASGTLSLSSPAPESGFVVTLSANSIVANVPGTVMVPGGGTSATFMVGSSTVAVDTQATISASALGATQAAPVTVTAPQISSVSIAPGTVNGGSAATGTITLTSPAPQGLYISLGSDNAAAAVGATIQFPVGVMTALFSVSTSHVSSNQTATITASLNGVPTSTSLPILALVGLDPHSPWPIAGANVQNSGLSASGVIASPSTLWRFGSTASTSTPVVGADGTLYVTRAYGGSSLVALDGQSGSLKWRYSLSESVSQTPPLLSADGGIYFGDSVGNLYCVDQQTGVLRWNYSVWATIVSITMSGDGTLFVSDGQSVTAINSSNRSIRWRTMVSCTQNILLDSAGSVYACGPTVAKLDQATGTPAWLFSGFAVSFPAILAPNGDVVYSSQQGMLVAVNTTNGTIDWRAQISAGSAFSSPVADASGNIYVCSSFGIFKYDGTTGIAAYLVSLGGLVQNPTHLALTSDGTIYLGGFGSLVAFSTALGTVTWSYPLGGSLSAIAIGGDGTVYLSNSTQIFAIN